MLNCDGLALIAGVLLASAAALAAPADNGDGTYSNPILYADYSDPDVIRVGDDFYMVASDFTYFPGIPVLHSKDLVNWTIIGHAFERFEYGPKYDLQGGAKYGSGCWAPSIRWHEGKFYVYFAAPDVGCFMTSSANPAGPWAPLTQLVKTAENAPSRQQWEDPCPIWDDDGKAYLVHSHRGGGILVIHGLSPDGTRLLDEGKTLFDDRKKYPSLEGPKSVKKNGYYYIFAPAGGVEMGYQTVFRSRNVLGPYEDRIVMEKGRTNINGPHQGGYVETPKGEGWFVHFQQVGAYGRIVHLQPVTWVDDWPIIGEQIPGKPVGQPVMRHKKPDVGQTYPITQPQTSDEFEGPKLGLQWQWNHNPVDDKWSLSARPGYLRLTPAGGGDLHSARNTLTQKISSPVCTATAELDLAGLKDKHVAGLCLFGDAYGWIGVVQEGGERKLQMRHNNGSWRTKPPKLSTFDGPVVTGKTVWLRTQVARDQTGTFAYSLDGQSFTPLGEPAKLYFDWWKGSKIGLFCYSTGRSADAAPGFAEFNWLHYVDK